MRRTAAERATIVAQSDGVGQTDTGFAQQHEIVPSQFAEVAVLPDPVVPPVPHDGIDIVTGSVLVRLPKSTAAGRIVDIARRLARQG